MEELKISISEAVYKTLFHRSCLVSLENNIINIGCPSPYIKDLIEKRYYSFLKDILDRQTKQNNSLLFTVKTIVLKNQMETGPLFTSLSPLSPEEIKNPFGRENHKEEYRLRSDFTFENFAVSSSNQLPFAAATAVAKNPGSAYNPLFLWGGVGVGKTHLMQAIAHEILKGRPRFRIISCPGEEFTNEIINAIRGKTTDQFKKSTAAPSFYCLMMSNLLPAKKPFKKNFFILLTPSKERGGRLS